MGGFTNNDTPVAIAGTLARPCPMQAKGNTPVLKPGLAHASGEASPSGGHSPPSRGQARPPPADGGPRQGRLDSPIGLATGDPSPPERQGRPSFRSIRPQRRPTVDRRPRGTAPGSTGPGCEASPTIVLLYVSISRALTGPFPVRGPRHNRITPDRSATRSGTRGPIAAVVVAPTHARVGPLSQVADDPPPVTPQREEAGSTRGRGRSPEDERRANRGRGREVSRPRATELWRRGRDRLDTGCRQSRGRQGNLRPERSPPGGHRAHTPDPRGR